MSNGDLYTVEKGAIKLYLHPGQQLVWDSGKRFILALAGAQSGKTTIGPLWLWREIQRRGPGDYMVVGPTLRLLEKKTIPEFRKLFEKVLQLGAYRGIPSYDFEFSREGSIATFGEYDEMNPTRIMFGYAGNPDSLESATAKAIWCDEAGQDAFREASWEALARRGALNEARVLITTTPYNFGWLKKKLYDPWKHAPLTETRRVAYSKEGRVLYYLPEIHDHPYIDVVRFESALNPVFPLAEFDRLRASLPTWRFDLFYRAIFTRPAGMIYDCFSEGTHVCEPFTIPKEWPRYMGLDFGGVNTAAVYVAHDTAADFFYIYKTYKAGGRTAVEHVEHMRRGEDARFTAYGGAPSEDQWRSEFGAAGLPIGRPLFDGTDSVEVGIDRVYGALSENKIRIFNTCQDLVDEFQAYSRELNDVGEATEKIADKETYHLLDAVRYIIGGWLRRTARDMDVPAISLPYGGQQPSWAANPFDPFGGISVSR